MKEIIQKDLQNKAWEIDKVYPFADFICATKVLFWSSAGRRLYLLIMVTPKQLLLVYDKLSRKVSLSM